MANYGYGDLSGMFGDRYSTQAALNNAMANEAASLGQLSSYGVGQASTYFQAAGGGTPLGSMLTQAHPTMQRQNILAELQKKHPNPDTPEKLTALATDLSANGFGDLAMKVREAANEIKEAGDSSQTMTNYMQDLRDIAQFQLSCDFNDPECAKKAQQLWLDQKRAGPEEKYAGRYAEADAQAFSDDLTASKDMYSKALYYGKTIDQSLGFLEEGLYTGPAANVFNAVRKVGVAFGIAEPDSVAEAEQFKVNSMKAIMAWVQKTKGAISEAEMKLFADASEGLERSVAGNKLILLTAKSLAEYQKNLHKERVRWLQDTENPTRLKWEAHLMEWNETNANILPTAEEIKAALEQVPSEQAIIESDEIVIEAVN